MEDIRTDLQAIKERNKRVEADKAWEVSATRRGFIIIVTYATAAVFLWLIGDTLPFWKAFVPAAGYLLSSLSLPWIKEWWMRKL